jgi:glycosyltransferase involved in cell wall biosynthesis
MATALAEHAGRGQLSDARSVVIAAMDDRPEGYEYGPEVVVRINQHRREDYREAAEYLNLSKADVVLLQHEYGLFGGQAGDYIFELLDRLDKPVVSTLHTVLAEPSAQQADVLRRICQRCECVAVMAERAGRILREVYDVSGDAIRLIPHGVPDVPFGPTEPFKARFQISGRPTMLTFGLLSPGKSIEVVLDALARVVPAYPNLVYIVLGVTHPGVKRESGESYRISLERRAAELGIEKNVAFHNRYVSIADLREYLQAADIYATPYGNRDQITSGTLAYAVACGKAVVSTPYWHAQELLADGRGRLVEFGDVDGFAGAFRDLLGDAAERQRMQRAAYDSGRAMVWPNVARQYAEVFREACRTYDKARASVAGERKSLLRMSLPEVKLGHLIGMTDDTGILQHSIYATPDRHHGYASDDIARAMIVCGMAWTLYGEQKVLPLMRTYLAFLHYAQVPETGRFRNFMSYDRRWLEEDGSNDCQGRVLWSLGHLIAHAPEGSARELAEKLFRASLKNFESIDSLRTWTFAILGLHYFLREHPGDGAAQDTLTKLAERLNPAGPDRGRLHAGKAGDDRPGAARFALAR